MKRILIPMMTVVLASACSVLQAPPTAAPAPAVDSQATIASIVQTSAAQTMAAQPSPMIVPATETATPVVDLSPIVVVTETPSSSPVPNLTTTPATATSGPVSSPIASATATQPGGPTVTPTLGILKYGTLPPAVPSAEITIINKSKAQAYISLQNDPPSQIAILEYPVEKQVKIRAPLGYYDYVVWVGGRKIVGEFTLHKGDELTITIYKDKVTIQ